MLRLTTDPADGEQYLAFSTDDHFKGDATPYLSSGRPLAGGALDRALSAEGVGLKSVTIELDVALTGGGPLERHTLRTRVPGTLDREGLARVVHAQVRQYVGSFSRTDSPPEQYIAEIVVGDAPSRVQQVKRARRSTRPRREVVEVVNRRTGEVLSRVIFRDAKGRFAARPKRAKSKRSRRR